MDSSEYARSLKQNQMIMNNETSYRKLTSIRWNEKLIPVSDVSHTRQQVRHANSCYTPLCSSPADSKVASRIVCRYHARCSCGLPSRQSSCLKNLKKTSKKWTWSLFSISLYFMWWYLRVSIMGPQDVKTVNVSAVLMKHSIHQPWHQSRKFVIKTKSQLLWNPKYSEPVEFSTNLFVCTYY